MEKKEIHEGCTVYLEGMSSQKRYFQIEELVKGAGKRNVYCKISENNALMILREDRILLIDAKYVEELSRIPVYYTTSRWTTNYYCVLKCKGGAGQTVKVKKVSIGKIVCDLRDGIVKGLHKGMEYPYDGRDCHHKYDRLNNRDTALESLTKSEHRKRHMNCYGNTMKSHNKALIRISREDFERLLREAAGKGVIGNGN